MAFLTYTIKPDEAVGLGAVVELVTTARWGRSGQRRRRGEQGQSADAHSAGGQAVAVGLLWASSAEAAKKCVAEGRAAG